MAKSNGKDRDLKVIWRKTASLAPYAKNARTHSDAQVAQIAASITEYGFTNPVLIDEKGGIIAGHGRVQAANMLKRTTVPCIVLSGLTAAQRRAYVIADNKLALNAGWNEELLRAELGALKLAGFDLALTGFTDAELRPILAEQGKTDPDEAPPVPTAPVSRTGDIWLLGKHRLLCGDSTKAADVAALLAGAKPHLMVTDPPYGIGFRYAEHDDSDNATNRALVDKVFALAPISKVWTPGMRNLARDIAMFPKIKILCWWKRFAAAGNGIGGALTWEPIFVHGVKGGRLPDDHLDFTTDREAGLLSNHPCPKPTKLFAHLIGALAPERATIYEPFSGSGTTIIAAEMTGRRCYAIEIAPQYVDVALLRWQAYTGKDATLEATGETYAATKAARARAKPVRKGRPRSDAPGVAAG